ncbi:unnamed protein product [Effrenium voratum]|nr:unnamed protein product [Effrenium voratum]
MIAEDHWGLGTGPDWVVSVTAICSPLRGCSLPFLLGLVEVTDEDGEIKYIVEPGSVTHGIVAFCCLIIKAQDRWPKFFQALFNFKSTQWAEHNTWSNLVSARHPYVLSGDNMMSEIAPRTRRRALRGRMENLSKTFLIAVTSDALPPLAPRQLLQRLALLAATYSGLCLTSWALAWRLRQRLWSLALRLKWQPVAMERCTLHVAVLSGRTADVSDLSPKTTVREVRRAAEAQLQLPLSRLLKGETFLAEEATLQEAEVADGDVLTAAVQQTFVASHPRCKAMACRRHVRSETPECAECAEANVVTWGFIRDARRLDVQAIQCSDAAFAALSADGAVTTWGDPRCGGDSSAVQPLHRVRALQSSAGAFAALDLDGRAVAWGDPGSGGRGETSAAVRCLAASRRAFAALRLDGAVEAWGDAEMGGDCQVVRDQLVNVCQIAATDGAFAAIRSDGTVVTWGHGEAGDCGEVQDRLQEVQSIQANCTAFAAIRQDGQVVTWGAKSDGGIVDGAVQARLREVRAIQATLFAFAALRADGQVFAWGDVDYGGDASKVQEQLKGVQQIQATSRAFAAIRSDGFVVTWGDADSGGDSSAVREQLRDVVQIQASYVSFAALRSDGSVVSWGSPFQGGDPEGLLGLDQLRDVQAIQASAFAFAALRADGSVLTWGDAAYGGDLAGWVRST